MSPGAYGTGAFDSEAFIAGAFDSGAFDAQQKCSTLYFQRKRQKRKEKTFVHILVEFECLFIYLL